MRHTDRDAFLSSLTTGTAVHLVLTDDVRTDAIVMAVGASGITIKADGKAIRLDSRGYRGASLVCRIEPSTGPAAEWNAARRAEVAAYRSRLIARAAV